MTFELLDHPADIGFRVRGNTLEDLFANCASALISIIFDPSQSTARQEFTLEAEGSDIESLLVNWLNEVLYFTDTKRVAISHFNVHFPEPTKVRCIAAGEPRDPERHPVRLFVKAVTYHQLKVSKERDHWLAEVYVDV